MTFFFLRTKDEEIPGNANIDEVWERFVDLYKQLMLKTKTYDDLSGSYLTSGADIQMKRCALDAFNETINMFREQIKLQEKMQNEGQPHEIKRYALLVDKHFNFVSRM